MTWLRAVWRELRQPTCVVAMVGMAVLVGILLWSKGPDWGTRWNELGSAIRDYMILLAPVSVVLGVWQGGRARRSGTVEQVASTRISNLARVASEVFALAIASYFGILVGVLSAAWSIVVVGGYGTWAAVGYLVGVLPAVAAYTAFGFGVGRWAPWRIVAPVAGVLCYLALGLALWNSDKLSVLMGGGWLGGTGDYVFDTDAWLWTIAFASLATVAFVGLAAAENRPAASRGWQVAVIVGAVLTGVVAPPALAATDSGDSGIPQVANLPTACTSDRPKVCVLKADQHLLPKATEDARRVLAALKGLEGAPTWAGPPIRDGRAHHDQLAVLPGDTTPWGRVDNRYGSYPFVASTNLFLPEGCPNLEVNGNLADDPFSGEFAGATILGPWLDQGEVPPPDSMFVGRGYADRIAERFAVSSDEQRRDYAEVLLAAAHACDGDAAHAAIEALAPRP